MGVTLVVEAPPSDTHSSQGKRRPRSAKLDPNTERCVEGCMKDHAAPITTIKLEKVERQAPRVAEAASPTEKAELSPAKPMPREVVDDYPKPVGCRCRANGWMHCVADCIIDTPPSRSNKGSPLRRHDDLRFADLSVFWDDDVASSGLGEVDSDAVRVEHVRSVVRFPVWRTEYCVQTNYGGQETKVWRRFSAFLSLYAELKADAMVSDFLPAAPQKHTLAHVLDPTFVESRRDELEAFVKTLITIPAIAEHPAWLAFTTRVCAVKSSTASPVVNFDSTYSRRTSRSESAGKKGGRVVAVEGPTIG